MSEVNFSELERTTRIDAEFYQNRHLDTINHLQKIGSKPLTEFVQVSDGNHASISDYFCEDGIPYYRGGDIYNFFIEQANSLKIPENIYNWANMKRSHLKKGDVLMSIVGAIIGNLSLVNTDDKATCSCKLAILRPNKYKAQIIWLYTC